MIQDLRHAIRMLVKNPTFTALAVLTLAIGIGANAAIFSIVNGVLLRALPYPEPDRIARLWEHTEASPRVSVSWPNFLDWREQSRSFEALAAYAGGQEAVLGGREAVFADVFVVTQDFFAVFGVVPALGRAFAPEEARPGGVPAVVVAHSFWEQTLGAPMDLSALTLAIEGISWRVVGVMPPGFAYPSGAEVWLPKEVLPDTSGRTGHNLAVVARLARGVSIAAAEAEMDGIAARLQLAYPGDNDARGVTVMRLHDALVDGSRQALVTLLGAVGLVLLIACVNVANAQLARGEERRKELAIRAALGARRSRLVRQLVTENIILALAGAAGGLLLAAWLIRALRALSPSGVPAGAPIGLDGQVLLFVLALSLLTPLIFGLFPSFQVSRTELREAIAEGGRCVASVPRRRTQATLIAAEISLALVLLVSATLLMRSFSRIVAVDPGFDASSVVTATISLPALNYPDPARTADFNAALLRQIRSIPGVRSAGAVNQMPLGGRDFGGGLQVEGRGEGAYAGYRVATAGFIEAMGIPLLQGRALTEDDRAGRDPVAVVSRSFAEQYLAGRDPIGARFKYAGMDPVNPWFTVVGVVADVRYRSLESAPGPQVYVASLQQPYRTRHITIAIRAERTDLQDATAAAAYRIIRDLDRDIPVEFSTVDRLVGASLADRRFLLIVLAAFAAVAMLLAAVGVYGLLSYSVATRTQEIGIRMALGAGPGSVVGLMLRAALRSVAAGMVLGTAGAVFAARALRSFLFGVEPLDPVGFTAAVLLLGAVACLAGYLPARRATRADPLLALRAE
jgi:putative ABC transport system permease protein